jgi:desulfoferrodoxin (superoxide reductase-like protein)
MRRSFQHMIMTTSYSTSTRNGIFVSCRTCPFEVEVDNFAKASEVVHDPVCEAITHSVQFPVRCEMGAGHPGEHEHTIRWPR